MAARMRETGARSAAWLDTTLAPRPSTCGRLVLVGDREAGDAEPDQQLVEQRPPPPRRHAPAPHPPRPRRRAARQHRRRRALDACGWRRRPGSRRRAPTGASSRGGPYPSPNWALAGCRAGAALGAGAAWPRCGRRRRFPCGLCRESGRRFFRASMKSRSWPLGCGASGGAGTRLVRVARRLGTRRRLGVRLAPGPRLEVRRCAGAAARGRDSGGASRLGSGASSVPRHCGDRLRPLADLELAAPCRWPPGTLGR